MAYPNKHLLIHFALNITSHWFFPLAGDLKLINMKNIFLYFILCFFGLSCHKEEPFDFSYKAKPERLEVFRHLGFDCQEVNGPNSFVGTVDGKPYCLFDTNITNSGHGMFTLISTPDPYIHINSDSNAVSTGFQYRIYPKEYKAGNFEFYFSYHSDGLTGYTKEDFLKVFFIAGLNLPLSTFYTTSPPNAEGIEGVEIKLLVYDGFPDVIRGKTFTTSDIVQTDDAYVTCIRSEKVDDNYVIELEVNLMLPSGSRHEGEPEPEMKNIKGRLVMQVEL